jgi:hypothetical protein
MYQFTLDSIEETPYSLAAPQGVSSKIFENMGLLHANRH